MKKMIVIVRGMAILSAFLSSSAFADDCDFNKFYDAALDDEAKDLKGNGMTMVEVTRSAGADTFTEQKGMMAQRKLFLVKARLASEAETDMVRSSTFRQRYLEVMLTYREKDCHVDRQETNIISVDSITEDGKSTSE